MWLPKRLMGPEAVLIEALSYNKGNNGATPFEAAHTTPGG